MQQTLVSSLRRAEQLFAQREGVVCGSVRLTYGEFGLRTRRLATGLAELGIQQGDRVAALMDNCHRYLETYTAIPAIGAVIVPLNTRHTISEHISTLTDCRPRVLILDAAYRELADGLSSYVEEILIAPDDYERLLASSDPSTLERPVDEDDLAAIFYTGGTTGSPKGVMLSHRNLVENAFHMTVGARYDDRDTFLHAAPMFHLADASSIYALIWQGARQVILPRFVPGAVLECIADEHISCTILVPTMVGALVEHPAISTLDHASLRLILHGGAPISTTLLRTAVNALGCSFTQAYGLTEASSHVAMLPNEELLLDDSRIRSAGRAVMGIELEVRAPDGSICPARDIGEITVNGPSVTDGYWNKPDETAKALRDGWFWTGDLGYVDEEGYVYLVDRAKDMIITGGENVYSSEVEEILAAHPAVAACAVIGIPDLTWGERVHAVVVAESSHKIDPELLTAHCKQRLAGYKCPRSFDVVSELPLSGAGKVLKQELRVRYQGVQNMGMSRDE